MNIYIETHGCKLNQADTQNISNEFLRKGFYLTDNIIDADACIINTCTVTHIADRKARNALRKAKSNNPNCLIIATGCYAEWAHEKLNNMPEIDLVLGNSSKSDLVENVINLLDQNNNEVNTFSLSTIGQIHRTRAMLKIQEGCDQICAYCIVPTVRGRERSVSLIDLINKINQLSLEGYKEVVLTGTQLGTYGFEFTNINLPILIKSILRETSMERIRLSSVQPQEFSVDLLSLWENERLCPHFHIPLQSGDDYILKKMRRRYTSEEFLKSLEFVRETIPSASITTDIIVGFPEENEDMFRNTILTCNDAMFSKIHIFPYSRRPRTSAYYSDSFVDNKVIKERSKRLETLSRQYQQQYLNELVGTSLKVLWENAKVMNSELYWTGLSDTYSRVYTKSEQLLQNSISYINIDRVESDYLIGTV
ncbi:MAG: tRNA (N(6)-L-threonylcarbamoyladenosine(37)-C(2))-methylthiotransferase MtaB [SAR202 cluster bacterium]|nr:tRNA (N(6)-L-threonylcarbamoyladenosine(37)-C(2))-methylthiotransferase MtaB [Chloroflexota bacterium]MQG51480.1 tRNA (N(6)-L-threonylcarbamoyladenosine(37)-C(2))-methylthiotransferase MtaB [SAR202 cluster bacterium]